MPRLTEALFTIKTCQRKSINLKTKPVFRQWLPAELKDKVRGRREKPDDSCMAELQSVLACWDKHAFESQPCAKEIASFQKCFKTLEATTQKRKEMDAKGLIIDEETNLSRKQINTLLKKNPQLRPKDKFAAFESYRKMFKS